VGFLRNISWISPAEAARLIPPPHLGKFPADLANPGLEYSGLYEDGWISDAAFVRLTQPAGSGKLVIRGAVPESFGSGFSTELRLLVDGQLMLEQRLRPGPFDLHAEVAPGRGIRTVEITFSRLHRLSREDTRPAAAALEYLGFEDPHAPP
jgi:hypothetical protein